jgi:hypothetical protein
VMVECNADGRGLVVAYTHILKTAQLVLTRI